MRLLILGGTAFLGRELARQAIARGYAVTCLARGTAPVADGARLVRADRDRGDALAAVAGAQWDAAIDLTRQPGHARRAARDLRAGHVVFISSGNVYARFDRPEQDESAELFPALEADAMPDASAYGEAKVACEQAFRERESWTIIRAGLIGGAGDASARSGYYPWRFAHPTGADVLLPPDPTLPVAMIDVEDLAAWTLDCAEHRVRGTFNATGPTTALANVIDTASAVAESDALPRYVATAALTRAGVAPWSGPNSLPLWLDDPDWRWFSTLDTTAARAQGLRTRPLADTLRAALRWENARQGERPAGLTDEQERDLRDLLSRG